MDKLIEFIVRPLIAIAVMYVIDTNVIYESSYGSFIIGFMLIMWICLPIFDFWEGDDKITQLKGGQGK